MSRIHRISQFERRGLTELLPSAVFVLVASGALAAMSAQAQVSSAVAQGNDARSYAEASASKPQLSLTTSSNSRPRLGPAEALAKAEALVKESLYHEIYGRQDQRDQLLEQAQLLAPSFAPAKWHRGQIEFNRRWVSIDDVPGLARRSSDLGAYELRREKSPDSLVGQLNLARWCESRGLMDQARAHWNQVLEFNADHAEARAKLGFRRVRNSWVAQDELDGMMAAAQRLNAAMGKWLFRVTTIRNGLLQPKGEARSAAEKQLAEINDSEAIPALEYLLCAVNEDLATLLVKKLSEWQEIAATQSLVRQAVYSPWELVRDAAGKQLKSRPKEEYVPTLLAAMYMPLQSRTVVFNENGQLVSREVFAREGRNAWEVVMIDRAYARVEQPGADVNETRIRAINEMQRDSAAQAMAAMMQSARTSELNKRIMNTLSVATGLTSLVEPYDWWDWWDRQNETSYTSEKSANTSYERSTQYVYDRPEASSSFQPTVPTSDGGISSALTRRSSECLAAGTKVCTVSGERSIETVRVGDLVLAQNPESGEVALKPVLRTTVRPPETTFLIESSGKPLRSTGGHLFWVAGEGWTKARNLQSGQTLHCATGTVQVSDVTAQEHPEQTYNLVVADFNTYFVGPEKILSHDVTERKPTRSIVPGLTRE